MKIRTKMLLFLLPTAIGCVFLIATILSYKWYHEIVKSFKVKLKSAILTSSHLLEGKTIKKEDLLPFEQLKAELDLDHLSLSYIKSSDTLPFSPQDLKEKGCIVFQQKNKTISGYALLFDSKGKPYALISAKVSAVKTYQKMKEGFVLIILTAFCAIFILVTTTFVIANKIALPVQRLNNSALTIAAGQYGDTIHIKGPKEITELANTLSTMSECLYENIDRLKEEALIKEKTCGKYESALLLQNYMLQKKIEECQSDIIAIKAISFFSQNPIGLLLDFPNETEDYLNLNLVQAKEKGFEGIYSLLSHYNLGLKNLKNDFPNLHLKIYKNQNKMEFISNSFYPPFIWSSKEERLQNNLNFEKGDFALIFSAFFDRNKIKEIFNKVLRFFSEEGFETCVKMLEKEYTLAFRQKKSKENIHLICFQKLY